jgi:hypothetical protein
LRPARPAGPCSTLEDGGPPARPLRCGAARVIGRGIRVIRPGGTTIGSDTTRTRRLARDAIVASLAALCLGGVLAVPASAAAPLGWGSAAPADPGHSLSAVSCPTVGLCVAVDGAGNVVFTTAPTSAGAWTLVSPAVDSGHSLTSVSCPTASLCFAADNHGSVFSSATPSANSGWTSESVDGTTQINAISCPAASLCVAVDNSGAVRYSSTPGTASSWTGSTIDSGHRLTAVSCPTTSLCAAVDNAGQVLVSTNPASGGWGTALMISSTAPALTAISCTSTALCVATAGDGSVHASANASAPTPTWSNTAADSPTQLNAASCSDVGVCVLGDQNGSALSSDTPTGAPPNWISASIDSGHALDAVSCISAGLCVAVDSAGQAIAATLSAPVVTTGAGSAATQTTASLAGTVNPNDAALADCHFDYGTGTSYGATVPCTITPSATGGAQAVVASLSGLAAGTTYHFRISASSGVAAAVGADATFTTPAPLKASPSLSGTPAVGQTLTCKPNVTLAAGDTIAYQWQRDTSPIAGATATSYLITPADATHHLNCAVTIAGDGGSATAQSGFAGIPSQTASTITESVAGKEKRKANTVSVPVTCAAVATTRCKFTLTLTVGSGKKATVVGSSTKTISAGVRKTLSVSLNATGQRMLRSHRSLKVNFTVRGTLLGSLTAVLRSDRLTFGSQSRHASRRAR